MFWKLGFHNQKAPLEALLEKDDVKLEDVLDQDEILQEAKAGNLRLVHFLAQPESICKLIRFTTEVVNGEDVDDKRRFKYPYLACELLVLELPHLDAAIVETKEHLKALFDFLAQPAPLPQSLSLYFVRVLQTLYTKKPQEVIQYIVSQDDAFALSFVRHIDTFGMNELILTLLGTMDEDNRLQNGSCVTDWWMGHNFVAELFGRLTSQHSADVHVNILRMLCELVRRYTNPNINPMAETLMRHDAVRQLMALMLDDLKKDSRSVIFNEGTNLVISIIDSLVRKEETCRQMKEKLSTHVDYSESSNEGPEAQLEAISKQTYHALMDRTAELINFLRDPGPLEEFHMTWGCLSPPLGLARLKTVELLLVMLKTRKRYVEDVLIQLNMINICLDLFFQYDMNNLLHILVDEIVNSCLVSDNDELITCLFRNCNILERILQAVKEDLEGTGGRPKGMRKGYFGHVTSISNKIHQHAEQKPLVQSFTQPCEAWHEYVHTTLAARNSADTVILGGANPAGIRNGDLLDGMDHYSYSQPDRQFHDMEVPEEVEEMTLPESAPHNKYAPTTQSHGPNNVWMTDDQEDRGTDFRDAAFDSRDAFLDEAKDEEPKHEEEEVWQERQIVDNSGTPTSEVDWGSFDDATYTMPSAISTIPKQNIVFFDVEDDSSSSDEEPHFVPSPTKGEEAGRNSAGPHGVLLSPAISPPVTSPPVTPPVPVPTHAPPVSPPVTLPPQDSPPTGPDVVTPGSVQAEKVIHPAEPVQDSKVDVDEEMRYSDFNFWRPNWDDVSTATP